MTTGQRIRTARKQIGLTQKELAQRLGLSFQSVAQWENDLRNPKPETLQKIADALGVDFFSLASWDQATKALEDEMAKEIDARKRVNSALDRMTPEGMKKTADMAEIIAGNPKYQRLDQEDIDIPPEEKPPESP